MFGEIEMRGGNMRQLNSSDENKCSEFELWGELVQNHNNHNEIFIYWFDLLYAVAGCQIVEC